MCFQSLNDLFFLIKTLPEDAHQRIAGEMNLSETAFIRKLQPGDNFTQSNRTFSIRSWVAVEAEAQEEGLRRCLCVICLQVAHVGFSSSRRRCVEVSSTFIV